MLIAIIVIVLVLVLLVGFVITGFNKLRTTDVGAEEALGGIDVQLTRRAELIPNLVETVKGSAAHASGGSEAGARAPRGGAGGAPGWPRRAAAPPRRADPQPGRDRQGVRRARERRLRGG